MFNALSNFVIFCRVERRLADMACTAYERDVRTCLERLRGQGIAALVEIPHARRAPLSRENEYLAGSTPGGGHLANAPWCPSDCPHSDTRAKRKRQL